MCMGKCCVCRGIDERACVVIVCVLVCMCCVDGCAYSHSVYVLCVNWCAMAPHMHCIRGPTCAY